MSLTLPAAFTTKTIIKENWLFQLWYDDEDEDEFFGLSLFDTRVEGTATADYKGCVLNKPTIRESIDLENSTATTSSINLTIANFIDGIDGRPFSTQLLHGSNKYINRSVKVYIQPDDEPDLSDCLLVYTGRLTKISIDKDRINLIIVAQRPWDNIMIPDQGDRTTNNIYKPLVYGDYVDNTTEGSGNDVYGTYIAHPSKYCTEIDREQYYLTGAGSNGTKGALFWDKYLQKFSAIDDSSSTVTTVLGERALKFPVSSVKSNHFWLDSVRVSPQSPVSDAAWQDTANIFLGSGFAYIANPDVSDSTTESKYLYLNCPNIDGEATQLSFVISMRQEGAKGASNSLTTQIFYENDASVLGYKSWSADESAVITANFITEYGTQDKKMPDYVTVKINWTAGSGSTWSAGTSSVRVYEARFETEYSYPDDATRKLDNKAQDFVYSGADGQISDIDESAITEIHEAYRDILHIYTSYLSSNTPTNWASGTNINAAKDWKIRYWILEPTPLIDVLEKLQYEGGFIGRFNGQNAFEMIYIPDSPSTSVTLERDDISDISITTTDFSSLSTKMEIEYQKHPAENRYMATATSTNSAPDTRADYNIQSAENIKRVKLDAYVSPTMNTSSGTKNDCFYRYYDHILGQPRVIVESTVVNPANMGLDVGDIIAFEANPLDETILVFASSWDDFKFMITDTIRTPGKLKITAREI